MKETYILVIFYNLIVKITQMRKRVKNYFADSYRLSAIQSGMGDLSSDLVPGCSFYTYMFKEIKAFL